MVLALVGTACPPPENDDLIGDETGGTPEPEPIDPFDGEGEDPPGDPDPKLIYRSPSSLGNGLVHDSRHDLRAGSHMTFVTNAQLEAGVDWESFVDPHAEKLRVGFRPSQVEANVSISAGGAGALLLHVEDRSVYVCDDDANYRTVTKTHVFSNLAAEQAHGATGPSPHGSPRPTAIDTFALTTDRFGFNIVWTYDNAPVNWKLVVGQPQGTFVSTLANLAKNGYRPISISSRRRHGTNEYAAIFVQDGVSAQDWQVTLGRNAMELANEAAAAWDAGFYPFRGSYQQGSQNLPLFDVIWIRRSPGLKVELRFNLDEALFREEDKKWRIAGYHLEDVCAYIDGGEERLAGLWVRHEPYLRWTEGIEVDLADPKYTARYEPLHDQVIQQMTLAGQQKFGEFFRPSATLHIFEGQELVLSRAYTYAGAIYPDTPLDATMPVASVSKSITAAAVVREMNLRQLPLTTPFAALAGIFNVPAMLAVPSVLDVLRNLGGFRAYPVSYLDHALIDQSIHGDYPITAEMMYDYVVLGNRLDVPGPDSYWSSGTYIMAQKFKEMVYSNPGYTMLGELIRVLSGLRYQEYVMKYILGPLNLEQEIYPDPGHRNAHSAPTKAGLRSHLIDSKHPYKSQKPRMGSEPVPRPVHDGDESPRWSPNAGPVDSSAPTTAANERYAGKRYLGGAPLAAGGWYADGKSLGTLVWAIAESGVLMPKSVAAQMWDPKWWNANHNAGKGWFYGLGWWVRGNWIAMAGGTDGSMALVLHNLRYDFTVVYLTNVKGNALDELLAPLMTPINGAWGTSVLGSQFPCVDDVSTFEKECFGTLATY